MESRAAGMAKGNRDDTLLEAEKSKVKTPPLFKVLLLNDDYTPMDFVVRSSADFFLDDPGTGDPGNAQSSQGRHGGLRCVS